MPSKGAGSASHQWENRQAAHAVGWGTREGLGEPWGRWVYACINAPSCDRIHYYISYSNVRQLLSNVAGGMILTNIRLGSKDEPRQLSNVVLHLRRSSLPPLHLD